MSGSLSNGFATLNSLVASFESGTPGVPGTSSYQAVNPSPSTTASGAYGFTNSTWAQYLGQIASSLGISSSAYPTAASAPPAVQDAVFNQAVSQNGLSDWLCPGCDPALSSYVANTPGASSLPLASPGGAGGTAGNPGTASPPTTGTGASTAGTAANSASSCGTAFNPLNWPCYVFSASIVQRIGYGIMGFVLIALALLIYALRTRDQG